MITTFNADERSIACLWDDALQQIITRQLLEIVSRPGTVAVFDGTLTHGFPAWATVLATLVDQSVTLADPHAIIPAEQRLFFGAPTAPVDEAAFVVLDGSQLSADLQPQRGDLSRPELGATIIVRVAEVYVDAHSGVPAIAELSGPGIQGTHHLTCTGLDAHILLARNAWCADFPRGVDLFLVDDSRCLAVPRSTTVVMAAGAAI